MVVDELEPSALTAGWGPLPAPHSYATMVLGRLAACSPDAEALVAAVAVAGALSIDGLARVTGCVDPSAALVRGRRQRPRRHVTARRPARRGRRPSAHPLGRARRPRSRTPVRPARRRGGSRRRRRAGVPPRAPGAPRHPPGAGSRGDPPRPRPPRRRLGAVGRRAPRARRRPPRAGAGAQRGRAPGEPLAADRGRHGCRDGPPGDGRWCRHPARSPRTRRGRPARRRQRGRRPPSGAGGRRRRPRRRGAGRRPVGDHRRQRGARRRGHGVGPSGARAQRGVGHRCDVRDDDAGVGVGAGGRPRRGGGGGRRVGRAPRAGGDRPRRAVRPRDPRPVGWAAGGGRADPRHADRRTRRTRLDRDECALLAGRLLVSTGPPGGVVADGRRDGPAAGGLRAAAVAPDGPRHRGVHRWRRAGSSTTPAATSRPRRRRRR